MVDLSPCPDTVHAALHGYVERGAVPGLVALVSRQGQVRVDVLGTQALGDPAPMRRDTIFRVTSMTKPVTAAAALVLIDDGKLQLDQPLDDALPELAQRRILKHIDGPLSDTVPAVRSITVRDLLTFRMGFGVPLAPPDAYPIQRAASELGVLIGPPKPQTPHAPDEWLRRLGTLPWMHQPGERWMYNTSSDVLGVLIARVSGKPLDLFCRERLFEPLGMKDTDFSVPASKFVRFASCYEADPNTGALTLHDGVADSQWSHPPVFPAGRDGLVSTADDFLAFGQMLLDGGTHQRERILSSELVRLMTTNQLTPEQQSASGFLPDGVGWGFGLSVADTWFGWDGGYGTHWRSDRARGLVALLLTQRLVYPRSSGVEAAFWSALYGA
jgi:CubicO group peptidase (beta-lactamase class C family)